MAEGREVLVHLTPQLCPPERLAGGLAVVIDVLRATTTIVHALAAGCTAIRPCAEIDEARALADALRPGRVLLGGERDGKPITGFDLGNSPQDYTDSRCRGAVLVLTTTNGTRAMLHAAAADRVLVAAFVNLAAVCEHLRGEARPIHVVCAGNGGRVALEDLVLAGAIADFSARLGPTRLNDGARLAQAAWGRYGGDVETALLESDGGVGLRHLGYEQDIRAAARVDRFALAPELRRDPVRVEADCDEDPLW
jgi:2-phosphosulfolactate phosphatase